MIGLVLLVIGFDTAGEPFRQVREFRAVVTCEERGRDCFGHEAGLIVNRHTYTTTTTHTDANGHTTTTTTTHYEITWQRADGTRQTREISPGFYDAVEQNQPADLRVWRGEVIGIEVPGGAEWFLPHPGNRLIWCLYLAALGLGVLLWGLFGWWDGWFMAIWRFGAWSFAWLPLLSLTSYLVSYGPSFELGETIVSVIGGIVASGVGFWMVVGSLEEW